MIDTRHGVWLRVGTRGVRSADCCQPYRRHWKLVARLHSVTDGGRRVRGVAHLLGRIYVVYSDCCRVGVYRDQQPFEPLSGICIPDVR